MFGRDLASSEDGGFDHMQHFRDILYTLIFFTAIFFSGKVCSRVLGLPALVGEIIVGILLGPNFADFVPYASALKLYGEIGLNLLVIEAGLHIDIETLELVGVRCLLVGVIGSVVPLLMTFGAALAMGASMKAAFGVGASLTSMSTGIVLNVLKRGGMVNQPVGQLIIAAAIVNEIVNLILLTELLAVIGDYDTYMYVLPIVIMFALVGLLGYAAIKIVPHILDHHILPLFPTSQKGNAILGILLSLSLGLMTGCKYTGSSELLGSFLGGFCFCTDHHVHRVWEKQVKRVLTWMIRVFFACTIGFSIPIKDFWTAGVWMKAGVFLACMSGKLAIGLLATPPTTDMMLTLAFAWGEWGEFSFIIATLAFDGGVIEKEYYNAIILAVSISIIVAPLMLERTLERTAKHAEKEIKKAMEETSTEEIGKRHNVFYCLQTRSHARWGQQSNLLSCVLANDCKIIDFRTFHPYHHVGDIHVLNELYLKDETLMLPVGVKAEGEDKENLRKRLKFLKDAVREAIHESNPEIKISRWEPGHVHVGKPLDTPTGSPKSKSDKKPRRNSGLSPRSKDAVKNVLREVNEIDVSEAKVDTNIIKVPRSNTSEIRMKYKNQEEHDLHAYRVAHDHLLIKAANRLRHRRFSTKIMRKGTSSLSISYHDVRPHHELDGFVHVEEHDAFPDYVSDASEQQVPSDEDEDEDVVTEDFKVKLDAGVSRAELLIEAERRRVAARRSREGSGDSKDEKNGDILKKIEKTRRFSAPGALSLGNLLDGKILGSLEESSNNRSSERDSFLGASSPRGSNKKSLKKTLSHEPENWNSSSKRSSKKGDVSIELSDMNKKSDGDISDSSE